MSQEYIAALAVVVVGVLQLFKVNVGTEFASQVIMALAGIWVMVRRYQKGDIKLSGVRR
jgi:hypothetical protein